MSLQILSDVIYLYIVMIFLYLVIPLITYLVSPVQNASLKKNDPQCFFFLPGPPWAEYTLYANRRTYCCKKRMRNECKYKLLKRESLPHLVLISKKKEPACTYTYYALLCLTGTCKAFVRNFSVRPVSQVKVLQ